MASLAIAAAGQFVNLPLRVPSSVGGVFLHGENQRFPMRRRQQVSMSISTPHYHLVRVHQARDRQQVSMSISTPHDHLVRVHQGVCASWKLASSLTSAYFPTDDDEDDDVYYVQYKQHLRKVVAAALKNLDGQCIFLTGMMGSGKSTIGEILAKHLHYGFVDSDKLVEKVTGYDSVAEIFAEMGEEGFRDAEGQALQWLCNGISKLKRPVVVALGGGAVVKPENWIIAKHGIVVYIDVPSDILARRIVAAGSHSRPLFPPRCTEIKARKLLDVLYNQREESYGMARIKVPIRDLSAKIGLLDASTIPPALVAFEVLKKIERLGGHRET